MLEVAGGPWDMRPGGRTSPSDAFGPVAVFGDNPPAQGGASAAGASAAAADLPAAEVPRPDDDLADIANADAMMKKFGASMGCPRCEKGTGVHTHACRARMLSRMAS